MEPLPVRGQPDVAVALDLPTPAKAFELADRLRGILRWAKIGPVLFMKTGPDGPRRLVEMGYHVFLDLKFHDIPHVVGEACARASDLGVSLLTVHAAGGAAMVESAVRGARRNHSTRVAAVTVLTSLGPDDLLSIGLDRHPRAVALRLAAAAFGWGADGIVLSPQELETTRNELGPDPFLVTPGIRETVVADDDQARTLDAASAARLGSDLLVVGRPILRSPDPVAAARRLMETIRPASSPGPVS